MAVLLIDCAGLSGDNKAAMYALFCIKNNLYPPVFKVVFVGSRQSLTRFFIGYLIFSLHLKALKYLSP